eukprot:TRINITY_DN9911_c0_g1_i1.p3 TRINITY_DN9911_c0_g1~~TRINITY_DN9911_c0_g1_i1.p3  ORF type:complete len:101 (+),score=30.95 TRINITY_DN9911_c0_g1_i1:92-394(+)
MMRQPPRSTLSSSSAASDVYKRQANEEVQEIANSLKAEIEEKLQNAFEKFKAIEYQTQVVAGTNFKIKISVDDEKQILVKIYRPLPCYQQPLQLTEANFI